MSEQQGVSRDTPKEKTMDRLAVTLNGNRFFKGKTLTDLAGLLKGIRGKRTLGFHRGQVIAVMGDMFPYVGFVLSGSVEIQRPLVTGSTLCIQVKPKGEIFGGAAVFSEEPSASPCNIIGRKPGTLVLLPGDEVVTLALSDPQIARNVFGIFADRVLGYKQRVELLAYNGIRKKIAYYLLHQAHPNTPCTVELPFSKAKWAQYLNVSRPSLMRELKALETEGVLTIDKRRICIPEPCVLENQLLD